MSRSKLGSRIREAIQIAAYGRKMGWSEAQLREFVDFQESRRRFVAGVGLASLAAVPFLSQVAEAAAKATTTTRTLTRAPASVTSNVLILGGGGAGLAAGYALQKRGVPFTIIEANSRLGGRIFTKSNFNSQGQFVEMGGELVNTDHSTLIALAKDVGVSIQSIYDPNLNPEIYSIGGQTYTFSDLVANIGPFITQINSAIKAGALYASYQKYTNNPAAKAYDNMSTAQLLASMNGKVASWVIQVMGIWSVAEFGLDLDQMSSVNMIYDVALTVRAFQKQPSTRESLRVMGGSQRLTDALAAAIPPASIIFGANVVAINRSGANLVVSVQQGATSTDFTAAQIINTLPFSTLRLVSGISNIGLSPAKVLCINNIGMGTNSKIIMEFNQKPWLTAGTVPASAGTVYTDRASLSYWDATRSQPGSHGIMVNYTGGAVGAAVNGNTVLNQALPDLARLYPSLATNLVNSLVSNWTSVPTALGSYACMKVGQFQQFNGAQGSAELSGQFLFAGEACDQNFPGFMEGAYRTGIAAANVILTARHLQTFVADNGIAAERLVKAA